jgi:uncharacterized protein (TIGR02996 family)
VPDFPGFSTAYARGYQGTWRAQSNTLFLLEIAAPHGVESRNALDEMYPRHGGAVEASWYSGEITSDDSGTAEAFPFVLVVHCGKILVEQKLNAHLKVTESRLSEHARGWVDSGEWGFLAAIHANYPDQVPRLVYADWLEERGDARAAMLRLVAEEMLGCGFTLEYLQDDWILPTSYVDPDDRMWYWRRLAGIPEWTPDDRHSMEIWRQVRAEIDRS